MKEKIIDEAIWFVGIIVGGVVGAGMMIVVNKAVERAKIMACFDYKKTEVCEELEHEQN